MWKNLNIILWISLIWISGALPALGTHIKVSNKSYSNKKVVIYSYQSPINNQKVDLFSGAFDATGKLEVEIPNTKTVKGYCDLGTYKFIFFLVPKKEYSVILPPFKEKNSQQKNSLYFKHQPYIVGFKNLDKEDINYKIQQFDQRYDALFSRYKQDLFFRRNRTVLEKALGELSEMDNPKDSYLHHHIEIRKSELIASVKGYSNWETTTHVLNKMDYLFYHDTYIRYFNRILDNELYKQAMSIDNKALKQAINSSDYTKIRHYFINKGLGHKFVDHYILKGLHDALYYKSFKEQTLLSLIKQLSLKGSSKSVKQEAKEVLKEYHGKVKRSIKIEAKNIRCYSSGASSDLSWKNKYQYWAFLDLDNMEASQQIKELNDLNAQLKQILNIAIVTTNDKRNSPLLKDFKGSIMVANHGYDLKKKCQITGTPTYVLLNKKMEIINSNALRPTRGFQNYFVQFYREEYIKEQRAKYKKSS